MTTGVLVTSLALSLAGCGQTNNREDVHTCWELYGPGERPLHLEEERPILRCLVEQHHWPVDSAKFALLLQSGRYGQAQDSIAHPELWKAWRKAQNKQP